MKVRVTKRAQAQIDRAATWWDDNRPLAPEAFDEDPSEAFSLLSVEPGIGVPVTNARTPGVLHRGEVADRRMRVVPAFDEVEHGDLGLRLGPHTHLLATLSKGCGSSLVSSTKRSAEPAYYAARE
jgi:plasmid stabilization system protein ParE